MKRRFAKILSAMLSLMVLAMPFAGLAEEEVTSTTVNVTATVGNIQIYVADSETNSTFNASLGADVQLDITCDPAAGLAGDMKVLSGDEELLSAGLSLDFSTLNLVAGVDGMTDAVLVPIGSLMEQMTATVQDQLGENADLSAVTAVMEALEQLVAAAQGMDTTSINEIISAFMTDHVEYTGEVEEHEEAYHMEGTYQQYAISYSMVEAQTLYADLLAAVKQDENVLAALQAFVDAVSALLGAESGSVADIDPYDMVDETSTGSMVGVVEINPDNGNLLVQAQGFKGDSETDETMLISVYYSTPEGDERTYMGLSMNTIAASENTVIDADLSFRNDAVVVDTAIRMEQTNDYSTTTMDYVYSVDMSERVLVNYAMNMAASYQFSDEDEPYTYGYSAAAGFAGDVVATEEAMGVVGTFTEAVDMMGTSIAVSGDASVLLTAESTVDFDMPINLIDITTADEDTMTALMEEFNEALGLGLNRIMQLPGIQSLISTFMPSSDAA